MSKRLTAGYLVPGATNSLASILGGTITISGAYTIHTFSSSDTFICPVRTAIDYIIVGGGGGGGSTRGGGGGAGGLVYGSTIVSGGSSLSVVVGAGGAGGASIQNGSNGGSSSIAFSSGTITALGGGYGALGLAALYFGSSTSPIPGGDGGSGGGGTGYIVVGAGGNGTSEQGFNGGAGLGTSEPFNGGGGGGAGGSGGSSTSPANGGIGASVISSFLAMASAGVDVGGVRYIAGGGGAGSYNNTPGSGGYGGGGSGGNSNQNGSAGIANTGGGGGGGGNGVAGGNGGSGIVIIRYVTPTTPNYTYGIWTPEQQLLRAAASTWAIFVPRDRYFSNVSLLLHMDGSNGSTTFTDSSSNALTVTANGGAQISTAQYKWNGASGAFNGSSTYLELTDTSSQLLLSGDFTIECWVYFNSVSGTQMIMQSGWDGTGGALGLFMHGSYPGKISLWADSYTPGAPIITGTTSLSTGTWYHVAATRSGNDWSLYLNGTSQGTATSSATVTRKIRRVGAYSDTSGTNTNYYLNGYIDDLRITKGVARYTSNFTPPTGPFLNF